MSKRSSTILCLFVLIICGNTLQSVPSPSQLDPTRLGLYPSKERTRFSSPQKENSTRPLIHAQVSTPAFVITQLSGTQFLRGTTGLKECKIGEALPKDAALFVRSNSRLEATATTGELLRVGAGTNLELKRKRNLEIYKGALFLSIPENTNGFTIASPLSQVEVHGEGALMMAVTEIGGLKCIGLLGNLYLSLPNQQRTTLHPGELIFIFTEGRGVSRKVNLELATVMQTSSLIRDFEEPLPFLEDIAKIARKQNRRIRSRFRALVGDAKSDKDFELMILRDKEEKSGSK